MRPWRRSHPARRRPMVSRTDAKAAAEVRSSSLRAAIETRPMAAITSPLRTDLFGAPASGSSEAIGVDSSMMVSSAERTSESHARTPKNRPSSSPCGSHPGHS